MNKKAELAWELYLKMDTSTESFNLLQLIANACYKVGEFWYAAKAFDMLERMDPSPEHWEGKRGACCGTFQYIIAEKLPKYVLRIAHLWLRDHCIIELICLFNHTQRTAIGSDTDSEKYIQFSSRANNTRYAQMGKR